jgi:hypothetical protein
MRFQMKTRTLLGIGLEAICVTHYGKELVYMLSVSQDFVGG